MLRELQRRAAAAIEMARAAGATDVWASATRSRNVEVEVRNREIEKLQESTSRRLSVRLYVEGRYGTYGTSDLRDTQLRAFIAEAVAITRALEVDPHRVIPDPSLFENRPTADLELVDTNVTAITPQRRLETCMTMAERTARHDRVISATVWVGDGHSLVASASSNGFSGHHERTRLSLGGSITLRGEGDARPADGFWAAARHATDVPDATPVGDEALRMAVRRLGATQGPTRRTIMVVEPRVAGRLVSLLLGPANARSFSQERSFWRGRVGDRVISERLTITDEPLLTRGLGSRYYDGEGISARAMPVIDGGALRNAYVDTYYGRKAEMTPTTGSTSNLVVAPGTRDVAAITSDVEEGYLVTSWLGGNSDATTGDFSLGLRGHSIENGQVGSAVQEMNITGNLLELFVGLVEVGSDPWIYSTRRIPSLAFEGVQFSGA